MTSLACHLCCIPPKVASLSCPMNTVAHLLLFTTTLLWRGVRDEDNTATRSTAFIRGKDGGNRAAIFNSGPTTISVEHIMGTILTSTKGWGIPSHFNVSFIFSGRKERQSQLLPLKESSYVFCQCCSPP